MKRAFTTLEVLAVVGLVGLVGSWLVPKIKDRAGRAAKDGVVATAKVETATANVVGQLKQNSSEAAASVTKIKQAANEAPSSPQTEFIKAEADVALEKLEKPDIAALERSHARYVAFLEGRLDRADKLIDDERKRSVDADAKLTQAELALKTEQDARRAVDGRLTEISAVSVALERQRNYFILGIVVLGVIYLWTKITHFSPHQIASTVSDIRAGVDPITAVDSPSNRLQQFLVRTINKLK